MSLLSIAALAALAAAAPSFIEHANGADIPEYQTVQTSSGSVRGTKTLTLFEKRAYFSFRGIPYARPPIGALRFRVNSILEILVLRLNLF